MQLTRCPTCHARISLDQIVQDEAGRELLALMAKTPEWLATPLVVYLGLFRPATRDLSLDRTLRLARETLALSENREALATALAETVEAMRQKQDKGSFKPLTKHGYLKSVLETVTTEGWVNTALIPTQSGQNTPAHSGPRSKTSQVIDMLKNYPSPEGIEEWFTRTVCGSLAELMLLGLDSVPAADTMSLVAERFLQEMWPKRNWRKDHMIHGAKRIRATFVQYAESTRKWPSPSEIVRMIPKE